MKMPRLWTTFLIILVCRLAWIGVYRAYAVHVKHSVTSQDEMFENGIIAKNLVAGKGFYMDGNATFPSGITAHKPPAYPFLLACYFKVFGDQNLWPLRLIQAILMTVATLLVMRLFGQIFDPATGRLAGILMTLSPVLAKADTFIESVALSIVFSSFFMVYLWEAINDDTVLPVKAGFFMGASALTNAAWIPFFPFATAILFLSSGMRRWLRCGVMLGVAFCLVFPWTLRNHAAFHRWTPVMSTFPFNFWMGSNPYANGSFMLEGGQAFPIPEDILAQTKGMNEAERNNYFGKVGWQYAREHPRHFLKVRLRAWFYFWMTARPWMGYAERIDWINVGTAALMLVTALAGFVLAVQAQPLACVVFGLLFFSYSFVYGLTHADSIDRYRLPIDPYILGFSAYWLGRSFPKLSRMLGGK